jgi:uncharacterized protein (TIGR03790 family)
MNPLLAFQRVIWRRGYRFRLIAGLLFFGPPLTEVTWANELAQRVVILANANDPESLQIAQHYAEQRLVPSANIIALKLPSSETTTWSEFVPSLWQPLQAELIRRRWIDAIPMALVDSAGRKKYAISGHRIAALVICRGVPLRIANDPTLETDRPPLNGRSQFRTNAGSVDSELALMAMSASHPIGGFVQNPLFQNPRPTEFDLAQVIKVSRLDGPSFEDANALVDQALAAERTGLLGRAYVDIGGSYPDGDRWLESVAAQIKDLGFDLSVDREMTTFPEGARMDAPALYFGWYANDLNGPFALPGFRFPAGAIALHIHSYSAQTLRSSRDGWCGPLLARGVTATMGNVYEPYLHLTHQPHLFMRALAAGSNLVDAAYYSLQGLSWQAILVGDPLYRPFAVSNAEQLDRISSLPVQLAPYAEVRHMRLLESSGHSTESLAWGMKSLIDRPALALGYAVAQEAHAAGDLAGAARALAFTPRLSSFRPDEWALARDVANFLTIIGRPAQAFTLYNALLREKNLPRELHAVWQREADAAAAAAKTPSDRP